MGHFRLACALMTWSFLGYFVEVYVKPLAVFFLYCRFKLIMHV